MKSVLALGAVLTIGACFGFAQTLDQGAGRVRYADAIAAFQSRDSVMPPPRGAIVFTGSSIFRQWDSLTVQMAPLPVFNRAFGGSRTSDVLFHEEAVVLKYHPRLVVYYCGSNDINANVPADTILANILRFKEKLHAALPSTHMIYTAILRSPQKRPKWGMVDSLNRRIAAALKKDPRCHVVDLNPAVADANGEPVGAFYRSDSLHYKPAAYVQFTRMLKPIVQARWQALVSNKGK
jgi:hypothetical protein